ncbi:EVE domain-containing protein [Stutzerimonas tarimensis]|uniref:EVE domain-containing protein n=1 Tax=Stutzerimonas tarimensis TaxID=1507735 RepID=A0ABV7T4Y5_9GAMM
MPYWLMKSEPDEFSIEDLQQRHDARWDGVRNYQARNYLRSMGEGDLFFFYHSSCAVPGIAGIGRILSKARPDPTALDSTSPYHDPASSADNNRWSAVDVGFVSSFREVLPLSLLKSQETLAGMPLLARGNRLSVMPVSEAEWQSVLALANY